MADTYHRPVMVTEVLQALNPKPGGKFIDGTLGDGGHAEALLEQTAPNGLFLGIDRDPDMAKRAKERLRRFGRRVRIVESNFSSLLRLAEQNGFLESDGILLDLGVATRHLLGTKRGFSFRSDEVLDMRFNPKTQMKTAADIVNHESQEDLAKLFQEYGEEREAQKIAAAIVRRRPITTARMFADIVMQTKRFHRTAVHPATRVMQALRIAVNGELDALEAVLPQAISVLRFGGVVSVLAYHSLEDRMVKQFFRAQARRGSLVLLTKRPLVPGVEERGLNPRARSAKLRAAVRALSQESLLSV